MKEHFEKYLVEKGEVKAQYIDSFFEAERQVKALLNLLTSIFGSDKLVLKASKLQALQLLRSEQVNERTLALKKIVLEDPTLSELPELEDIPKIILELEEKIADFIARKNLEEQLEQKITDIMQERHEEYLKEIKMQIVNEKAGPETAQTLKKLAVLEKLEHRKLEKSAMEALRPLKLDQIVGQERGVKSLVVKLATPYPQHILIFGPPGVGKTTAARLALQEVKKLSHSPFAGDAPFVEVDGTTLRWDPRDVTNPLLGSVHDPIYQGAKKDYAETGIPEPKLGLVTDAHGGILFIDEIGEMDVMLQNKLLKVLEDKRVYFESAYYDPQDPKVPQYIKKIFEKGVPADFILIGATTRDPHEISPAIRSRCVEVYFEPLTPKDIEQIAINAGQRLEITLEEGVPELISEYTIEGRKTNNILADAYGLALFRQEVREKTIITKEDVYQVLQLARLTPYVTVKPSREHEVGHIFGLGVAGFLGSILEIEAVAFNTQGEKGTIRFNETAGTMAKDSVFNAASVFRKITGNNLERYDIHVNVIGGGNIDGPSAGAAVFLGIYSAITNKKILQDTAVTGELSIQGKIKPVGGIIEKIYGAKQAGMTRVLIPWGNRHEIPTNLNGIQIITVKTIEEAMENMII